MCIFRSEQVTKLRFWLKITSLIFKSPDLNPLDYHVRWNTGTLRTPKPTNIAELKTALLQYGMICLSCSLIRQPCDFERDFDFVLLQLVDTLNTQFKYREGSWHSLLKRLKCWRKSCAKFDSLLRNTYSGRDCMFTWKKLTLKFKQLYLLIRIRYFNPFHSILFKSGTVAHTHTYTHTQSIKRLHSKT